MIIIIITLLEEPDVWVYAILQFLNKFLKHCQQIQHQYPIRYYWISAGHVPNCWSLLRYHSQE